MTYAFHGEGDHLSVLHADNDQEALDRYNSQYRRTKLRKSGKRTRKEKITKVEVFEHKGRKRRWVETELLVEGKV